jgi:hypothetical protein
MHEVYRNCSAPRLAQEHFAGNTFKVRGVYTSTVVRMRSSGVP